MTPDIHTDLTVSITHFQLDHPSEAPVFDAQVTVSSDVQVTRTAPLSPVQQEIIDRFGEREFVYMEGFDHCVAGVVERFGQEPIVCYDRGLVIQSLMEDGMEEDEAAEFFEFNQIGAWVGTLRPCFLTPICAA